MKIALKKLLSVNRTSLLRLAFFSILFIIFFIAILYMLIHSPA